MKSPERRLLLIWLIHTGLVMFGLVVAWNEGLLAALVATDRSKLCLLIGLIYLLGLCHCGVRAIKLAGEIDRATEAEALLSAHAGAVRLEERRIGLSDRTFLPDGFVAQFLVDSLKTRRDSEESGAGAISEIYAARLKRPHEIGWFVVDAMIKLGLLGTIIGFILMLGSVADTAELDLESMQKVLQAMSAGMMTALYTTLAGLVCSLSLAYQYQLLDLSADELLQRTLHLAKVQVLPRLA